jgi:steroid delta-isomerase-like uncharacterized protein
MAVARAKGGFIVTKTNVQVVHDYLEQVWNGRAVDLIGSFFREDAVVHNLPRPLTPDRDGVRENVNRTIATFPDFTLTIDDTVVEGDRVAVRLTFTGTHRGGFYGMPATGKSFSISAMAVARLADAKIVEWWQIGDTLGLLRQIGAMPA